MPFVRQTTLRSAVSCRGIGLHGGMPVGLALRPAAAGSGIVFLRVDGGFARTPIPARHDHVVGTTMCTTLGLEGGPSVATVEHVMAALAGLGVDNALVEVDGAEVPVMDGSALPFVDLIERAGVVSLEAPRRVLRVLKPVTVGHGARSVTVVPSDAFTVSITIAYDGPPIARQSASFRVGPELFKREIAPARTYGFLEEIESLRARGLALGGSLDNAIVVSGATVLNEGGLRFPDEFVRHKILDGIGDLALCGAPILGHFHGEASGHALNQALLRAVFDDPSAYLFEIAREADHDALAWALPRLASA